MRYCKYGLSVVTPPSDEPVSTEDAKTHCRIPADVTDFDNDIDAYIQCAREYAEAYLGRRLITQTWDTKFDAFPNGAECIEIPNGPVQSIASVTYTDTGGTATVWTSTNYTLDTSSFIPRVYPAYTLIWPQTRNFPNAVTIRADHGYGAATAVPARIVHAIKLLVGHWLENHEVVVFGQIATNIPWQVSALLKQEKAQWF